MVNGLLRLMVYVMSGGAHGEVKWRSTSKTLVGGGAVLRLPEEKGSL